MNQLASEPEALQLDPHDRTHPNAIGTRVAARVTRDLLLREKLVPSGVLAAETSALDGAPHPLDAAGALR